MSCSRISCITCVSISFLRVSSFPLFLDDDDDDDDDDDGGDKATVSSATAQVAARVVKSDAANVSLMLDDEDDDGGDDHAITFDVANSASVIEVAAAVVATAGNSGTVSTVMLPSHDEASIAGFCAALPSVIVVVVDASCSSSS